MHAVPARPTNRSKTRWHRSRLLHPLNDRAALNELLGRVNPLWSLDQVRARVVQVIVETDNTRTFVFKANRHWKGFRAGQHTVVEVDIAGTRHHRCFSISSAPIRRGSFSITVKRQSDAKVSAWLHKHAKIGTVLNLSAATGDFTLGDALPERLLLLSAGSGITPVMSILRQLRQSKHTGEIIFVHSCHSAADFIFCAELQELAHAWPALKLHRHYSAETGRLDVAGLAKLVPDFTQIPTMLCGPEGFMRTLREAYASAATTDLLKTEDFRGPLKVRSFEGGSLKVLCGKSQQSFTANSANPLLIEAESAGLKPRHGCRMGICRSCQCRKVSGVVENLLTGQVCSEPNQLIQLCISVARSDLELAL